jgi:hypothetical protein
MSKLVQFARTLDDSIVVYHFCNQRSTTSTQYAHILRSIVAQLLRNNDDLVAFLYEEYVLNKKDASPSNIEQLVPLLLSESSNNPSQTTYIKIFLDGVDECEVERQQKLLRWLHTLSARSDTRTICKILISGRETDWIVKFMRKQSSLSLSRESRHVTASIRTYVSNRFQELRSDIQNTYVTKTDIDEIEETIVQRANGKLTFC